MHWAKDYKGEIVAARRGVYLSFGMTCPACGEAVYLRQGKQRRPHFAHYSKRAKPDCELYFSPAEVVYPRSFASANFNPGANPTRKYFRCGIFLTNGFGEKEFELTLTIPPILESDSFNGELMIGHRTGVKELNLSQLAKGYSVPVYPNIPLLTCSGTGDATVLAEYVQERAELFSSGINMFTTAIGGGRLLQPEEGLEWGESYWMVSDYYLKLPSELENCVFFDNSGKLASWKVFKIALPVDPIKSEKKLAILKQFVNRQISKPFPRVYLVDPPPHHYAVDGAAVYSYSPKTIYFKKTSNLNIGVSGDLEALGDIEVKDHEGLWSTLSQLKVSSKDTVVSLGGVEQIVIRFEKCPLIRPEGIVASCGEYSWDLIADTPLVHEDLVRSKVTIDCRSPRLANFFVRANSLRSVSGSIIVLPENSEKVLQFGGFGEIKPKDFYREIRGEEISNASLDAPQDILTYPEVLWLYNLIGQSYGPVQAELVKSYMINPNSVTLQKLGPILTSPYLAHITAAVKKINAKEF